MGKKLGDRKDGVKLRNIHAMHFVMPLMYPNRCDNEAFISERIDLTNINAYLEKKNADNPEYAYNLFQVMVTAVLKTITLRPKMNRFIANNTMYLRNEVSAAFTVKKIFSDNGAEALAQIHTKGTETIDDIHDEIFRQISLCRSDKVDDGTKSLNAVASIPGPIARFVGWIARWLDRHGWMPYEVIKQMTRTPAISCMFSDTLSMSTDLFSFTSFSIMLDVLFKRVWIELIGFR